MGGAELATRAIAAGLVDEYQLFLVPVLVAGGKRALPNNRLLLNLELVEERRFRNGTVYLYYRTTEASARASVSARNGLVRGANVPCPGLSETLSVRPRGENSIQGGGG